MPAPPLALRHDPEYTPGMAHLVGKDIYRQLGQSVDRTTVRMPWSRALRDMLAALYTPEEAALVAAMPRRPSPLSRVARVTGRDEAALRPMLDAMCKKGLVCDIWEDGDYLYMASPFVIGFFEFSMMRTRGALDHKKWAELFHAYMFGQTGFFEANFGDGQQVSIMRALPWEETVGRETTPHAKDAGQEAAPGSGIPVDHVEILDFEKASAMVEGEDVFAVGLCSCRHEKEHLGGRHCEAPLETCTSMGNAARFLVRNELAREISREEMRDILHRSRELALTLTTDNVKRDAGFICHCCGCCCNLMNGIRHSGYPGVVVSSTFIAGVDEAGCVGCGKCARACPVDAIRMVAPQTASAAGRAEPTPPAQAHISGTAKESIHSGTSGAARESGHFGQSGSPRATATPDPRESSAPGSRESSGPGSHESSGLGPRESSGPGPESAGSPYHGAAENRAPGSAAPANRAADTPGSSRKRPRKLAVVDADLCLGCGACALRCPTRALRLDKRQQKIFHPEDSFERVITQCLERGTLQDLLLDNPSSRTQGFMRAVLGGFLKLSPVRKALMSETLRSRFLDALRKGAGA